MKGLREVKILPLSIVLGVALFLNGGFFDHSVAFIGIFIISCFGIMLLEGAPFYTRDKRFVFWIPIGILCIAIVVSFWAVDYMDNMLGVLRLSVVCLWLWLLRCREQREIAFAIRVLPWLGCFTVLLSFFSVPISSLKPYFWENSRMSGFFQYANTNGLFLALGIMILIYSWEEEKRKKYDILQLILLFIGLLFTGSRSVLLLFLLWGCFYGIRRKEFRKPFLMGIGLCGVIAGIFVAVTGNTANIGRIFTIFTSNSTFWGRLLYYRDGLMVLCKSFWGLGRLGYYYSQGTFQSGVYHIKFIHNDFLQLALDYGIFALVLLLIFLGWQLWKGKQGRVYKELFSFLCIASLTDFHFQYLFIIMVACLFLDYGEGVKEKKSQLRENYVIFPILIVGFLYVGIATGCGKNGKLDIALSMLPDYTFAQEKMILREMGSPESFEMATGLLQKNPYNITASIARGTFFASQLAAGECIDEFDRVLELDPYNVEYYEQYEVLLQNMIIQLQEYANTIGISGDDSEKINEDMMCLRKRADSLQAELKSQKERTSALAYRIKDKPVFTYE